MKITNSLFVMLMLSLSAVSAEHSEMKMSNISSSASSSSSSSSSSQECMSGMKSMHDKMMAAVKESDPDKAFAEDMVAHHEETMAMVETELKYGGDPEIRKLTQDIIKTQGGEIEQMST